MKSGNQAAAHQFRGWLHTRDFFYSLEAAHPCQQYNMQYTQNKYNMECYS